MQIMGSPEVTVGEAHKASEETKQRAEQLKNDGNQYLRGAFSSD